MPEFTLIKGNRSADDKSADRQILKHRIKKALRGVALIAVLILVIWIIHHMYQNTTFNDYEIL